MLQPNEVIAHIAERRAYLDGVREATIQKALELWPAVKKEDWAVRLAYATKRGMPPGFYVQMYSSFESDWAVTVTLCHNPCSPSRLLEEIAGISCAGRIPTAEEDAEEGLRADDVKSIARQVLRQRKKET